MPLVVPGLTSNSGGGDDKTSKWMNDLVGKKIGETSNETVRFSLALWFPVVFSLLWLLSTGTPELHLR